MPFHREYEVKQLYINNALNKYAGALASAPQTIHKAMEYSLLSGGKRLRPILLLSANELASYVTGACGDKDIRHNMEKCLPLACGLEMIHTYSLIHDDLPAMDNDDIRRGKPTNHVVFGEAVAILAGDGLLNLAYETMIKGALKVHPETKGYILAIDAIACAAGVFGMIGGQVADVENEGLQVDEKTLKYIHDHKTGALIIAAMQAGVLVETENRSLFDAVTQYGKALGLAFQITDDILDVTGDPRIFGKNTGSDEKSGKSTFPAMYGLEKSKKMAAEQIEAAISSLEPYKEYSGFLTDLALSILNRNK